MASAATDTPPHAASTGSGWVALGVALFIVAMLMFAPVFAIREMSGLEQVSVAAGGSGAVATLGVLFRAGARQVLRSTLMTAIRATTRTASRRAMRTLLPTLLRLFIPQVAEEERQIPAIRSTPVKLLMGFVGLAASFAVVISLEPTEVSIALLGGLSLWEASALAAVPMLLHYTFLRLATAMAGVRMSLHLPLDGILIQAYFSGAASFLPILTDVELVGESRAKAYCAGGVLVFLLSGHAACGWLGSTWGLPHLGYLSSVFLVYGFVYSFPLHPLDGKDVWDHSRLAWLILWGANTATFLRGLPEAMYDIL